MINYKVRSQNHLFEGKLRDHEKTIVNFFIEMGNRKGQSQKVSEIVAYLFIHGNLTQEQLKQLTGFSLGSISSYLATMISIGLVEKRLIKGTHKYEYFREGDINQFIQTFSSVTSDLIDNFIVFLNEKIQKFKERFDVNDPKYKKAFDRTLDYLNLLIIFKNIFLSKF